MRRRSQRVQHLQDPRYPDISNSPAIHGICTPENRVPELSCGRKQQIEVGRVRAELPPFDAVGKLDDGGIDGSFAAPPGMLGNDESVHSSTSL
jgi:hypothetical protein